MKLKSVKPLFYSALLLLLIACFFTNCIKETHPAINLSTLGSGNKIVPDTLPSFYSPAGLALDAAGNLYVADYGNNIIRKITPAGIVSTFAGNGIAGSFDATGILASFNGPKGVAVDATGNVYVADSGNDLIREITPAGVVTTLAGSDSTGSADGPGLSAGFFGPAGITVGPSANLFVADAGNNLIRMVTSAGVVSTLAGTPDGTTIINPTGVAADAAGNIFVANYLGNNILKVSPAGIVTTFAGNGQQGADNGPASSATFYFPNSVALDAAHNVYVADGVNNLIRKITPAGVVSTLAGSGAAGAADSTGTAASFNGPSGLVVDAAGNVYVADSNNNLIRKITPAGVVSTIAGSGAAGAKNGKVLAHRNSIIIASPLSKHLNIWYRPPYQLIITK